MREAASTSIISCLVIFCPSPPILRSAESSDRHVVMLRTCGPLDRMLRELGLSGLLLCEQFTHAGIKDIVARAPWAEIDEISGFDFGRVSAHKVRYDAAGIDSGVNFLHQLLAPAIDTATAEISTSWPSFPRVLMIDEESPTRFINRPWPR